MIWPLVKLSEVATLINGRAYKKHEMLTEGKYPLMRVGNFFSNRGWYYSDLELPEHQYCDNGDLLYAWSASFGPRIWDGDKVIYHYHIWKLALNEKLIDKKYMFYALQKDVEKIKQEQGSGSTMIHVTKTAMEDREIPLPPLVEQKRIAAILDKADAIRRKRQQAIKLADDFLRSVFLDMFGDPVTNPKGWEVKKLGEITYKVTDGTHKTPTYTESGIPFLSAKNIKPYGLDWTVTKFISASEHAQLIKRCNPEPGDILLSKSGSLGTPAIVNTTKDFSLFESAALIKLKKEFIHPLFLVHFMKSKPGQKLMLRSTKGVAIKHLHLTDLRELKVIIPSIEHQGRFTKIVESLEVTISKMANKQHSPDDMFNSLSQKAFAGEL